MADFSCASTGRCLTSRNNMFLYGTKLLGVMVVPRALFVLFAIMAGAVGALTLMIAAIAAFAHLPTGVDVALGVAAAIGLYLSYRERDYPL
jgi:hypothetical protein